MPKPGETIRCDCSECSTEFEVTLEPKVKDAPESAVSMEPQVVNFCPFCGGSVFTAEDEE